MRTLLLIVVWLTGLSSALSADRPNILFCFADDWGRYASAYAQIEARPSPNQVIRTPNLDAVAARGVLFRHAFVPAPSCTPCRSAILSGRYFFNTGRGAILTGAVWDARIPSYPLLLQRAGYEIGKTGKVWSPGTPADAPYGEQKFAYQKAGLAFNQFSQNVTAAVAKGQSVEAAKAALYQQVRDNFDAFLKNRDPNKPFAYWFGPTNTHRKWIKGSGKALWNLDPDTLKSKLPAFMPDVPEVREDFADYLGEVLAFDAFVGVLVERLKAAGELEKTLIVISGDHGAPGFPGGKCNLYDFGTAVALIVAGPKVPGGRVVDDFVNLMDLTPTFLEIAGVQAPAGLQGRSLWPTLTSTQSGQVDATRTWVITGRERHTAPARVGGKPYPQRALRTKDFLYIRNFAPERLPLGDPVNVTAEQAPSADELENNTYAAFSDMDAGPTKAWLIAHRNDPQWKWHYQYVFGPRPAEELYDLRTDPDQIRNVAADPKYAAERARLAEELKKRLTEFGDPRLVEEKCRFELSPFTDVPLQKK